MNAVRLTTPMEKVQQLQEKLGHAAKTGKSRRFPVLYYQRRTDVLWEAWYQRRIIIDPPAPE